MHYKYDSKADIRCWIAITFILFFLSDYPDPLLLTGPAAKLAVDYLYGRGELFYSDIPHVRAILYNQKQREENGLPKNVLGSLRPVSPFHRYRNNNNNQFFA